MAPQVSFARVPSRDTVAPQPVLAIDLAALAAQIGPDYPVEALKEALLAAAAPPGASGDSVASLYVTADGGGDSLLVSREKRDETEEEEDESVDQDATLTATSMKMRRASTGSAVTGTTAELGAGEDYAECITSSVPRRFSGLAAHFSAVPAGTGWEEWEDEVELEENGGWDEELYGANASSLSATMLVQPGVRRTGPGEVRVGVGADDIPEDGDTAIIVPMPGNDHGRAAENLLLMRGEGWGGKDGDETEGVPPEEETETYLANPLMNVESEFVFSERQGVVDMHGEKDVLLVPGMTAGQQQVSLNVKYQLNYVGYAILFVATVCAASCGTVAKSLPGIAGATTASWQMQTQALMCLPLAIAELAYATPKARNTAVAAVRDPVCWRMVVFTSFCWVFWAEGFFVGADYSSVARVWCLNCSHTILVVLLGLATGQNCSSGEKFGVSTAVFGMALMEVPAFFGRGLVPLAGDALALLSSVAAIYFLDFASRLRQRLPLFTFMLPVSIFNAILHSIVAYWLQGGDFGMTQRGAFGWLSSVETLMFALYVRISFIFLMKTWRRLILTPFFFGFVFSLAVLLDSLEPHPASPPWLTCHP